MKIGLVLHPYGEKQAAGLGRAIYSLSYSLIKQGQDDQFVLFTKGMLQIPGELQSHTNWKHVVLPKHTLWLDSDKFRSVECDAYVFFTPMLPYFWVPQNSVVVVHDLSYRFVSETFVKKMKHFFLGWLHGVFLSRTRWIVAISEATRKDVQLYHPRVSHKASVIHNGFNPLCKGVVSKKNKHLLFVGVLKERKNVLNLLRAYYALRGRGVDAPLLIIAGKGSGPYFEKIKEYISANNLESYVRIEGYVSTERLRELYQDSVAFVFPSFIEGFGLPILEAMSCGVPVVTSQGGALEETAGASNAIYVDPKDPESIADGLEEVIVDTQKRSDLKKRGLERVKEFSWDKAALQYLSLIHLCKQ